MIRFLGTLVLTALATMLNWAVWLGWDQRQDVAPDGQVSGPYQPWQVMGLVLVLVVLGWFAARLGRSVAALLGLTLGMATACAYDWSDDGSGLWGVGAVLVALGTALGSAVFIGLASLTRPPRQTQDDA